MSPDATSRCAGNVCRSCDEQPCTLIAAPAGISVDVAAEAAEPVSGGTLEACWAGDCVTRDLKFRPATTATASTCSGDGPDDVCSAQVQQTGDKHAFAESADLPQAPVRVVLTLTGAAGQVLERDLEVTPEPRYPNGPQCGGGGAQAGLVVDASGEVRERD